VSAESIANTQLFIQPTLVNPAKNVFTLPEHFVGTIIIFEYLQHDSDTFFRAFVFVRATQPRLLACIVRYLAVENGGATHDPDNERSGDVTSIIV
jgi:hypothetical protein